MNTDRRLFASATQRNRDAILLILRRILPASAVVLEIGSGSGEHAVYFASRLANISWIPSDRDPAAVASIAAWVEYEAATNVRTPVLLDIAEPDWPVAHADAMVCINVIHYSPWQTTPALFAKADQLLPADGALYFYGPYRRGGRHTALSNETFDAWLKDVDPSFGVRDLEAVEAEAANHGFRLEEVVEMPANNLSLVFRRV